MEKTEADLWAWYRDGMHRELHDLEKRRRVIQARASAWIAGSLVLVVLAYVRPDYLVLPPKIFVPIGCALILASLFKRDSTVELVLAGMSVMYCSLLAGPTSLSLQAGNPGVHSIFPLGSLLPALFVGTAAYFDVTHRMRTFTADFKGRVLRALAGFVDESWTFTPNGRISRSDFDDSRLFPEVRTTVSGEDLLTGNIGGAPFSMSEYRAEQIRTYRDKWGVQRRQKTTLFSGLVFVTAYNRHFPGEVFVLPDLAEKLFGFMGTRLQSWNGARGELIKLEDPVFEKHFVVYGSDQISARTVLEPAIMDELVRFREKSGAAVRVSIRQGRFFAAVPLTRDLFEPPLFREITRFAELRALFDDLTLFVDLARAFDRSTQVWNRTSALSAME